MIRITQTIPNLAEELQKAQQTHNIFVSFIICSLVLGLIAFVFLCVFLHKRHRAMYTRSGIRIIDCDDPSPYGDKILIAFAVTALCFSFCLDIFAHSTAFTQGSVEYAQAVKVAKNSSYLKTVKKDPRTLSKKYLYGIRDGKNKMLYEIRAKYKHDHQDLVDVSFDSKTKMIIYRPDSKAGRAYLRIVQYLDRQDEKPIGLQISVLPYQVSANYANDKGKHKIVCNVDNKVAKNTEKQTIVKY